MERFGLIVVEPGVTRDVRVEPGSCLTVYTSGAATLGWRTAPEASAAALTFLTTAAAGFTWPLRVPADVSALVLTAPGATPVSFRISVDP